MNNPGYTEAVAAVHTIADQSITPMMAGNATIEQVALGLSARLLADDEEPGGISDPAMLALLAATAIVELALVKRDGAAVTR